jgi:hypothetical protein
MKLTLARSITSSPASPSLVAVCSALISHL